MERNPDSSQLSLNLFSDTLSMVLLVLILIWSSISTAQYRQTDQNIFESQYDSPDLPPLTHLKNYKYTTYILVPEERLEDELLDESAVKPDEATGSTEPHDNLSFGVMVGLPTEVQLFLTFRPRNLPRLRVMGGPMIFDKTLNGLFERSKSMLSKGKIHGYSADANLEIDLPYLKFIKLAAGYQLNRSTEYGRGELARVLNDQLLKLDSNFTPLRARDVDFKLDGFYIQSGLRLSVFRVEFGLTQHRLHSLSQMVHQNVGELFDDWSVENLSVATRNGVSDVIQDNEESIEQAINSLYDNVFPHGMPFIRIGVEINHE